MFFRPAIPRGGSPGVLEALKLWNNDKIRYIGKDVSKAVEYINKTTGPAPGSKQRNSVQYDFGKLVTEMNGTESKSKFGAHAVIGCPLLFLKLKLLRRGLPELSHC